MKTMYFVVNLMAGKAVMNKMLGAVIDEFIKNEFNVTVHITQSGDDAAEQAAYACEKGYDLLTVAGGDGTLSEAGAFCDPRPGEVLFFQDRRKVYEGLCSCGLCGGLGELRIQAV